MSDTQCINCNRLGACSETSVDKVMTGYCCIRWEEMIPEVYAARLQIVTLFGRQGVKAIITKDLKED